MIECSLIFEGSTTQFKQFSIRGIQSTDDHCLEHSFKLYPNANDVGTATSSFLSKNQFNMGYLDNYWRWSMIEKNLKSLSDTYEEEIKADQALRIPEFGCWNKLREIISSTNKTAKILVKKNHKILFENIKIFGTLEIVS